MCCGKTFGLVMIAALSFLTCLAEGKRSNIRQSTKKIIRIEAFENCKDRPNSTEYLSSHNYLVSPKIVRVKMDQYISSDYVVNHPVKSILATIQMMKCETSDVSTCEFVMRMKIPNLCDQLLAKNQLWTPLVDAMHPSPKCPMTKQVYRIANGSFSSIGSTPFLTSMPGDNVWGVKVSYSDVDNAEAGCLYLAFKLYHVKVKQ